MQHNSTVDIITGIILIMDMTTGTDHLPLVGPTVHFHVVRPSYVSRTSATAIETCADMTANTSFSPEAISAFGYTSHNQKPQSEVHQ